MFVLTPPAPDGRQRGADGQVTSLWVTVATIHSGSYSPNRVQSRSDSASMTQQNSHRTTAGRSYTNGPFMSPYDPRNPPSPKKKKMFFFFEATPELRANRLTASHERAGTAQHRHSPGAVRDEPVRKLRKLLSLTTSWSPTLLPLL